MMRLVSTKWSQIKEICDNMYKDNVYQTPYQSWDFLNHVGKGFQLRHPFASVLYKTTTLALVNSDRTRCILPLEINRFGKKIRMRGFCSSIGHLDFIYPADFRDDEFQEMLVLLQEKHKGYSFIFDRISEKSLTYLYSMPYKHLMTESECVSIPLCESWEDWLQNSVGTKTRKNIRRAYRDLESDGINIRLEIFNRDNPVSNDVWIEICRLFAERSCVHNGLNSRIWTYPVYLLKKYDPIATALHKSEYSMITALFFNNELVAFGCGTRSNDRRFISMRHGVNMKFKDYQIGLIYTSEVIRRLISEKNENGIIEFDRSRGAEQHKIGVGGVIHKNYQWVQILEGNL